MAAKISINRAAIFCSIARETFSSPIAAKSPADRPAPAKLLQEIDRVQPAQSRDRIIDRRDGLAATIRKCSRRCSYFAFKLACFQLHFFIRRRGPDEIGAVGVNIHGIPQRHSRSIL